MSGNGSQKRGWETKASVAAQDPAPADRSAIDSFLTGIPTESFWDCNGAIIISDEEKLPCHYKVLQLKQPFACKDCIYYQNEIPNQCRPLLKR